MRLLKAFVIIGATAIAPAGLAQESYPIRLLDVPADYQALKPLPTDWPRPSNTITFPSTRYTMGVTGPVNMRRPVEPRRLSIETLRGLTPPQSRQPPSSETPPAVAAPSTDGTPPSKL
jgi:hypothetical protein